MKKISLLTFLIVFFFSCKKEQKTLQTVSVTDFQQFVEATNYVTVAEQFGWSIVQLTVDKYEVMEHVDWRCPDGAIAAKPDYPVTQVSYNDAVAYSNWAKVQLPDYEGYWEMVSADQRRINENAPEILPNGGVNIVGNVWDITLPDDYGRIRLAGGSYLCNKYTCNGTNPDRVLFVDAITGNSHIGFSVFK